MKQLFAQCLRPDLAVGTAKRSNSKSKMLAEKLGPVDFRRNSCPGFPNHLDEPEQLF